MAYNTKEMATIKQVIIRHSEGESNRSIAQALGMSKNTVNRYVSMAEADSLSIRELSQLDDVELDKRFNGGSPAYADARFKDFIERLPYLQQQMKLKHMTLELLWQEYRREKPDGYGVTQFRFHYRQNTVATRFTTVLADLHKGGDALFLDFAGDTLELIDDKTGEVTKVQVFVAVLPASDYAFAMAVPSQKTDDFCHAVTCCLHWLGGVPHRLVPDNLKAAVQKADRYCPVINTVFEELANHYGCVADPARPGHPRDKALVEGTVKIIYRRVYAALRGRKFHDLDTLNAEIMRLVEAHNAKRMQKYNHSRQERFAAIDKPNLLPLPQERFEVIRRANVKVGNHCCVCLGVDQHYYSVPQQYIGQSATIRFTYSQVKIYIKTECVATYYRDRKNARYTMTPEHLPSTSQNYRERSPQYYIARAEKISPLFKRVIELLFNNDAPPERFYRSADGLFALNRSTEPYIFEKACKIAIERNKCTYPYLKNLVKALQVHNSQTSQEQDSEMPQHSNIRGSSEYK